MQICRSGGVARPGPQSVASDNWRGCRKSLQVEQPHTLQPPAPSALRFMLVHKLLQNAYGQIRLHSSGLLLWTHASEIARDSICCTHTVQCTHRSLPCRFDVIFVARKSTMESVLPLFRSVCPGVPIIFDTVDVHFVREARQAAKLKAILMHMGSCLQAS